MGAEENYKALRAELDERLSSNKQLAAIAEKISAGKADFSDTARYSQIVSHIMGDVIFEYIGEITMPLGKEYVCKELLRDHYKAINDILGEVQASVDDKLGIHLKPVKAPFPTKRVDKAAHSLEDPTVPEETIKRRARSATENIANSMHDDYIKENAKTRTQAGLKCYLVRDAGGGCCSWCQGLEGRFDYATAPDDIFRRHDNCTCTVTYECGRQRQDDWSKKTWEEPEDKLEARKELEKQRLPKVNSREQAKALDDKLLSQNSLTSVADSAIIGLKDNNNNYFPVTDEAIKNVPHMDLFNGDAKKNTAHQQASIDLLLEVSSHKELEAGTEFSIVYDSEMKRIEGFGYVQGEVGRTRIDNPGVPYHAFHNHGSNGTLSYTDLLGFAHDDNMLSLTAQGNLGSKYVVISNKESDKEGYSLFLKQKGEDELFYINGKSYSLISLYESGIGNVPEVQRKIILNMVVKKNAECLKGASQYGIRYIKRQ